MFVDGPQQSTSLASKEFFGCSKNQRIPFIDAASEKSLAMVSPRRLNPGISSF